MLSTSIKRAAIILAVCTSLKPAIPAAPHFPEVAPPAPLGLPRMIWPLENPYSAQKAELGWTLFYDARLSKDGTLSCMSCHSPGAAFTDGRKVSLGVSGQMGTRNSPTVANAGYNAVQLRDGRARLLETQCLLALTNSREMGLEDSTLVEILSAIPEYRKRFRNAFGRDRISSLLVSRALATFERLVVSGDSAYDRFVAGDKTALTESQQRGMKFFFGDGRCGTCHPAPLFTNGGFANIGVGMNASEPDWGRFAITLRPRERGAFRIPSLREVARTAPYMHDGSVRSLADVLIIYHLGGLENPWLDPRLQHVDFKNHDEADLIEFLTGLNGRGWQQYVPPTELPK